MDSELGIPGYSLFRLDQNTNAGGVAISASNYLKPPQTTSNQQPPQTSTTQGHAIELVAVGCNIGSEVVTTVSPSHATGENQDEYCARLSGYVATCASDNIILAGDFNCDLFLNSLSSRNLRTILGAFDLRQVVSFATHGLNL